MKELDEVISVAIYVGQTGFDIVNKHRKTNKQLNIVATNMASFPCIVCVSVFIHIYSPLQDVLPKLSDT